MTRVAVFASGTGTLLEATLASEVSPYLVLSDRECRAIAVARQARIHTAVVPWTKFKGDRVKFTAEVLGTVRAYGIGFISMQGFMRILDKMFFSQDAYQGRVINSHPSLLPAYPGEHAVQRAVDAGETVTGCTIHFATKVVDDPTKIIFQRRISIVPGNKDATEERIKAIEQKLNPLAIQQCVRKLSA